jgi:serine/threonine-protein kinase
MPAERFERLRALFEQAQDLPEGERTPFLQTACGDDADLLRDVRELLNYDAKLSGRKTRSPLDAALSTLGADARPSPLGRQVGRYELVEEIGSGGMGRVFRARRREGNVEQWVALKLMRRERVHEALARRFSEERRILAHLQHPGIAHFVDAGTDDDGTPYVAMELVPGIPITEYCAQHRLDLHQRLTLFRQVLAAVSCAHRGLVIHRDIKPSNVLVSERGEAKLLDFGIAKPLSAQSEATRTQDRVFTLASAAPEQLVGAMVTVATDVYGLGALLFELLCGAPPFATQGMSVAEFERQVLHVPPRAMNAARRVGRDSAAAVVAAEIPADLENIVQKALRKEPGGRYASVEQFDADIDRFLKHEPVRASGSGMAYRLRKFLRRQRWPVAFATLATVAVIAVAVLTVMQARAVRAERDRAQAALAVMKDAFSAADPSGFAGGEVTARQVLDSSSRNMSALRDSQPENYLALALELVEVQLALGLVEPAAAVLAEASEVARLRAVDGATDTRMRLFEVKIAIERSQLDAATALIDRDLAQRVDLVGKVGYLRGMIALRQRKHAEAIAGFRIAVAGDTASVRNRDWVQAQLFLSEALVADQRVDEAISLLGTLKSTMARELGADHVQTVRAELAQLRVLQAAGQTEAIRTEGLALVERLTRSYGRGSALTSRAEVAVASAFIADQDYAQAAEHMRRAADGYEQSLGAEHPRSFRTRFNVGTLLQRVPGRVDEADASFRTALSNAERRLPVTDPTLGFFRLEYAEYLLSRQRASVALDVLANDQDRLSRVALSDEDRSDYAGVLARAYVEAGCAATPGLARTSSIQALCSGLAGPRAACQAASAMACQLQRGQMSDESSKLRVKH